MSFKLFKKDNFFNGTHQEFLIDSKNDLIALETSFDCELGDKAFTPNGTMYTRHSDDFEGDLWEEIKETSGGGSDGGGLPDYSEANDGDVLSIENGALAWKAASGGANVYVLNKNAGSSLANVEAGQTVTWDIQIPYPDDWPTGEDRYEPMAVNAQVSDGGSDYNEYEVTGFSVGYYNDYIGITITIHNYGSTGTVRSQSAYYKIIFVY